MARGTCNSILSFKKVTFIRSFAEAAVVLDAVMVLLGHCEQRVLSSDPAYDDNDALDCLKTDLGFQDLIQDENRGILKMRTAKMFGLLVAHENQHNTYKIVRDAMIEVGPSAVKQQLIKMNHSTMGIEE